MNNQSKLTDRRLFAALDLIDQKYIDDVFDVIKDSDISEANVPVKSWKTQFKTWKQVAAMVACLVLLSCAIPIVNYVLQRYTGIAGGDAGTSTDEVTYPEYFYDMSDRDLIEHIGEVPEEFADIVEQNLFANIWISGDKIIKKASAPYDIAVYDLYGNILHSIEIKYDIPDSFSYKQRIHSLSDGTYLYVVPYNKPYNREATAARVIRFDESGDILFNTELDVKGTYFEHFFEIDDGYIIADGVYKDSYFVKLDKSGNVLKTLTMGGNEKDRLYLLRYVNGVIFALMCDQDLTKEPYETVTVRFDGDLNVVGYSAKEDFPYQQLKRYSVLSYMYVDEFVSSRFPEKAYDDLSFFIHRATAVIEYDDYVLLVSRHETKHYYPLMLMSSPFCFTETVYTAYSFDGDILWRTAVDSTNYEYLAELEKQKEELDRIREERSKEQTDIE